MRISPSSTASRPEKESIPLTSQEPRSKLWRAADILRGQTGDANYKSYIFSIPFLRRLSDRFDEEVEIDANLRDGLALDKTPYLHARRLTLAEAVALDEAELGTNGQTDGFGNECEGHYGV